MEEPLQGQGQGRKIMETRRLLRHPGRPTAGPPRARQTPAAMWIWPNRDDTSDPPPSGVGCSVVARDFQSLAGAAAPNK